MQNKAPVILAIDDNQDNLVVLKVLLSETFPKAILYTATSGKKGIELCNTSNPDVILLDIAMPGMDGYEVCSFIKSDVQLRHIPVVMLTATVSNAKSRIMAMEAGADAFLAKPIDESELTAQIRAMLRIKELEDQKITEKERLEIMVQARTMELEQELNERKKAEKELQLVVDKLNKSRGSELSLLNDLRSEVLVRKTAEEKVLSHLVDQRIISEFSRALVQIKSRDEIYEYIGRRIFEVAGDAYVLVVKSNPENQTISINKTFGTGNIISQIKKLTGFDVLKLNVSLTNLSEEENKLYRSKELIQLKENAVYTLSARTVDPVVGKTIEKLAGIKDVYCIGFSYQELLYGGVAILCREKCDFVQHKLVENLVNLASVAFQRLYAEEQLRKEHDNLNAILNSAPVGMLVIDENKQIVMANPAASLMFKTHIRQIENRFCGDFLGCSHRHETEAGCGHSPHCPACNIQTAIEEALVHQLKVYNQEHEITRPIESKASNMWVNFSIEPLELDGRKHVILSLSDITPRKLAEEEKRKTENHYKSLIEHAPDGIVLVSIEGDYKFISKTALKIFGYQSDDIPNARPNESTHPDDLPRVYAVLEELLQDPSKVPTLEYRFQKKDGSWRWIQSTFSNLLYDPAVEAIVINFRDITERVEAEEAMKISETKYRELFQSNKDGISIFYINEFNLPTTFVEVNNAACEMLGYTREEFLEFAPTDLEVGTDAQNLMQRETDIKTKGFAGSESKIKHKNGHLIDIELLIVPVNYNNRFALMNIVRDISERKRAAYALQEKEEQLSTLINTTDDIVCFKDGEGRWLRANKAILDAFGITNVNYFNKNDDELAQLTSTLYNNAFLNCVDSNEIAWRHKTTVKVDEIIPSPDGSKRIFEVAKTPVFHPDGSRKGLVVFGRDITKRKQDEEALKLSEQMYRLMADNVSDVIWTMDNDFRYTFISPSIFQLRGLTQAEALQESYMDSMTADSLILVQQSISSGMELEAQGKKILPSVVEIQQKHKDGKLIWVEIVTQIMYDTQGKRSGVIGVSRDITRRKETEAELNESRQQLMDIIDFLPDATFVIDNDKKVIAWNKAIEEMTGVSKRDMIGQGNHAYTIPFYGKRQRQLLDLIDDPNPEIESRYTNFYRKDNSSLISLIYNWQ